MRRSFWLLCLVAGVCWASLATPTLTVAADDSQGDASADSSTKAPLADDEYYEMFQVFADTLEQVERNYVEPISRRELMEAAIQGLLSKLDPYSNYIPPEEITEFRTSVESRFGGVGIQIRWLDDEGLRVVTPLVGTPAYLAGLQAGDRITAIDGQSTEAIETDNPAPDARIAKVVEKLKGDPGTSVEVTFRHADQPAKTVTLTREVVRVATVLGDHRDANDAWDFMLDEKYKIGYIRITSFSRDTPDDLRSAMIALKQQGLKGLIIDLRFDPGGLLTAAVEVCDMFVPSGRIVSTKGRNVPERVWDARHPGTFEGFPMAVLVNHLSASASEIVSACLQDHDRAVIIGERTWGKGSVQNVIELEGGKSALKLTTAGYHRPNGKNIHRNPGATEEDEWGVTPDDNFLIRLSPEETRRMVMIRAERDILHESHAPVLLAAANPADVVPEAKQAASDEPDSDTPKSDDGASKDKKDEGASADDSAVKPATAVKEPEPAGKPSGEGATDGEPTPSSEKAQKAPSTDTPSSDATVEPETEASAEEHKATSDDDFVDRQLQAALDYLRGEIDD